jgi:hypothetical protein
VAVIKCKNGLSVSVQASSTHYCTPRRDYGPYTHYELGFPSAHNLGTIRKYAEDETNLTGTVYGWVPKSVVNQLIRDNGGLVSGRLP